MKQNRLGKRLVSAAFVVLAGVGGSVGTGVVLAQPASAVAYCSYYHHYGNCTWQERYQIDLMYWSQYYNSITASIKAINDANRSIVRNLR